MRGVKFGDKHTYTEWGLMLKSAPKVSAPEPKTYYVDVPGMHGQVDLSTLLSGGIRYKNREIEMEFITMAGRAEWSAIYSEILSAVHGQSTNITLDDDPTHYYTGLVKVGTPERDKKTVTLKITAEVSPFKKTSEGVEIL